MKKIIKLLTLLFIIMPIVGYAKTYEVDSTISIDFDNDWYVFTRNNYKGNLELTELGLTEEQMLQIFEKNHIYVDAINKKDVDYKFYREFFVRRVEVLSYKDMKDYSEADLKEFGDAFVSQLPTDEYEVYKNADNTYLKIHFVDQLEGKTLYMDEYVTVYNGFAYSFGLQTTDKVMTVSDEEFVKNTVDKLTYNDGNKKQENPIEETKKETDDEKKDSSKEDEELKPLDYAVMALVIICFTVIIVTLIITIGNRKKVQN